MKRVLVQSDYHRYFTGYGKQIKNLLLELSKRDDLEVFEAANGLKYEDKPIDNGRWQIYGTADSNHPDDSASNNRGYFKITEIVSKVKPDVFIYLQDPWVIKPLIESPWWKEVNTIAWTTVDSLPVKEDTYELAEAVDKFVVCASFAKKAMEKRVSVKVIHASVDSKSFFPMSKEDKLKDRKSFGIAEDDFLIGMVFKNQLRKSVPNLLDAFEKFKVGKPNARIVFHTEWGHAPDFFSDQGSGFNIKTLMKERGLNSRDVLAVYKCSICKDIQIKAYKGKRLHCRNPKCKGVNSCGIKGDVGLTEPELNRLYNSFDVYSHVFTSGGQEIPIQEAKLAGLPTMVTDYSCGEDCSSKKIGSFAIKWNSYYENKTGFIKASSCKESILKGLNSLYQSEKERTRLGILGRNYILDKYSLERVGDQFYDLIQECNKKPDWSKIIPKKNKDKESSKVAENSILVCVPRSIGDIIMATAVVDGLARFYPEYSIDFACEKIYFPILKGNPNINRILEFNENFLNPVIPEKNGYSMCFSLTSDSQLIINYPHNGLDKTEFQL